MSHFSVLVFTKGCPGEDELSKILAPWHEFECTGEDNEYVQDVDVTAEAVQEYEKGTERRLKDPEGNLHNPYEDRFYREMTAEETAKHNPLGTGCGDGLSWTSKDWGDGRGYRSKAHFVPEGWEDIRVPTKDVETFEEWAKGWYGKTIWKDGDPKPEGAKYGHILVDDNGNVRQIISRTNPNAKWDWWTVGGRYSNKFSMRKVEDNPNNWETCVLCSGTGKRNDAIGAAARITDPDYTCNGCDGKGKALKWPSKFADEGNQIRLMDLDFEGLKRKAIREREAWVDEVAGKASATRAEVEIAARLHDKVHAEWMSLPNPKPRGAEYYDWVEAKGGDCATLAKINRPNWEIPTLKEGQSLQDWIDDAPPVTTFAVVKDGKWYERGKMGWWACVSDEKDVDAWQKQVNEIMSVYDDDTWVTCVDCHI